MEHLTAESNPGLGVLVAGAEWGDVEFYGKWLLAAAKAEDLWKKACDEPDFVKQVDRLRVVAIPHFGITALVFLARLKDNLSSFVLSFNGSEGEGMNEFVMMVELGFFVRTARGYQMAVPTDLNLSKVKAAALTYARTEDEEYYLHPELVVYSMPLAEALQCQLRELAVSNFRRDGDRLPLGRNQSPS